MKEHDIQLPKDSIARQEAQRLVERKPNGTFAKGQSGNPLGRRPGVGALAARWREYLEHPPREIHFRTAANSLGIEPLELQAELADTEIETLGDLLCQVNLIRMLKGDIDHFREMGDRLDPKPRRVDLTVQPGGGAASFANVDSAEEKAAGESYYDELNEGSLH